MGPETDPLSQFLGPENLKVSQFLFKWIFLVSIELIQSPELVEIIFFVFYWPELWKTIRIQN
jgi:hypothetical protein